MAMKILNRGFPKGPEAAETKRTIVCSLSRMTGRIKKGWRDGSVLAYAFTRDTIRRMFKRIVELDPIVQHELLLRMMVEAC